MARIRSIKPEFWSDEKLSECSLSARLTFIGLWTFADDEGRMDFQPARLRMQIFPCGSVTAAKLREYLAELSERSLIRIYVVEGREYLDIPNFTKHQKINRPTPSKLPEHSLNPHGGLTAHSPLEGKGKEGIRRGEESNGREGKGHAPDPSSLKGPAGASEPGEDFSGQSAPPEEPQSRRAGSGPRHIGDFERINDGVSKLLDAGVHQVEDTKGLARSLHCSERQVEVAIQQLRDRGRLKDVAA